LVYCRRAADGAFLSAECELRHRIPLQFLSWSGWSKIFAGNRGWKIKKFFTGNLVQAYHAVPRFCINWFCAFSATGRTYSAWSLATGINFTNVKS